jgi:hypothetical protein
MGPSSRWRFVSRARSRQLAFRPAPWTNPQINGSKAALISVVQHALEAMADCPDLRVGTVHRKVAAGKGFGAKKEDFYADFVAYLEQRFAGNAEHGLIFMDGDGTDLSYLRAHRNLKLADRRLYRRSDLSRIARVTASADGAHHRLDGVPVAAASSRNEAVLGLVRPVPQGRRRQRRARADLGKLDPPIHLCGAGPLEQDRRPGDERRIAGRLPLHPLRRPINDGSGVG